MKLILYTLSILFYLSGYAAQAQLGINGSAHPSAALDVKSSGNDKAFYPPRLTTAQRNAILNPQPGAFVYDVDKGTMYLHDGQSWLPLATLNPTAVPPISRTASDGGGYDYFGASVSIDGNYAIAGAPTQSNATGAAYVFVRSGSGWAEQQKLRLSDGVNSDFFGFSVALSGNYLVVGAMGRKANGNTNQGAAYVFTRSGNIWIQQQMLTASDGAASANFGKAVAISGDYIIVGAPGKTVGSNATQGGAYIFSRSGDTWTEQYRLQSDDGASGDNFGDRVAIDGSSVVVGAYNKSVNGNGSQGAAYVFTRSGINWSQQQRLVSSDGTANDYFGCSVALSGEYVAVGAFNKTINGNYAQGAAYSFNRSGTVWTQQQFFLNGGEATAGDNFGRSVAISGDYILVGMPHKTVVNFAQGATYLFKRNGAYWSQQKKITDNSGANSNTGYAVGISNGTFIIGSNFGVGKIAFGTVD